MLFVGLWQPCTTPPLSSADHLCLPGFAVLPACCTWQQLLSQNDLFATLPIKHTHLAAVILPACHAISAWCATPDLLLFLACLHYYWLHCFHNSKYCVVICAGCCRWTYCHKWARLQVERPNPMATAMVQPLCPPFSLRRWSWKGTPLEPVQLSLLDYYLWDACVTVVMPNEEFWRSRYAVALLTCRSFAPCWFVCYAQ